MLNPLFPSTCFQWTSFVASVLYLLQDIFCVGRSPGAQIFQLLLMLVVSYLLVFQLA